MSQDAKQQGAAQGVVPQGQQQQGAAPTPRQQQGQTPPTRQITDLASI